MKRWNLNTDSPHITLKYKTLDYALILWNKRIQPKGSLEDQKENKVLN